MGARPAGSGTSRSNVVESPCGASIRLEDLKCLQAAGPEAVEPDPEQPLTPVKSQLFTRRLVFHGQWLAQCQNFEVQEGVVSEQSE